MNKPLRIIQVVNVRWFNATAWYGLFLSRLLKEAGHEVLVVGLEGTDSFAKAQEWGLQTAHLDLNERNPLRWAKIIAESNKLLKSFKPDIINCHRGEGFFLWAVLKQLGYSYALVRTRGDQRLPRNSATNRWLHKELTDCVIATNSAMARHFVETMRLDPEKISTILGGVDKKSFYPRPELREKVRAEFGYKPDDFVIGLLGRLDHVKGQKELLQAVAKLRGQGYEKLRLLLLGFSSGLPEETVRGWIKEFKLEDSVVISGKRADIANCMQALDLGVAPSLGSEAIARAVLEMMACGLPVIGSRVGVMPDLLPPKALVEPGRVGELSLLLQHCMQHPEFISDIKRYESNIIEGLGAENFLDSTMQVYLKAMANKK